MVFFVVDSELEKRSPAKDYHCSWEWMWAGRGADCRSCQTFKSTASASWPERKRNDASGPGFLCNACRSEDQLQRGMLHSQVDSREHCTLFNSALL